MHVAVFPFFDLPLNVNAALVPGYNQFTYTGDVGQLSNDTASEDS